MPQPPSESKQDAQSRFPDGAVSYADESLAFGSSGPDPMCAAAAGQGRLVRQSGSSSSSLLSPPLVVHVLDLDVQAAESDVVPGSSRGRRRGVWDLRGRVQATCCRVLRPASGSCDQSTSPSVPCAQGPPTGETAPGRVESGTSLLPSPWRIVSLGAVATRFFLQKDQGCVL